jgi:hypothetical protein
MLHVDCFIEKINRPLTQKKQPNTKKALDYKKFFTFALQRGFPYTFHYYSSHFSTKGFVVCKTHPGISRMNA